MNRDAHNWEHILVSAPAHADPMADIPPGNDILDATGERLSQLEARFDEKVDALATEMRARFQALEELLKQILNDGRT